MNNYEKLEKEFSPEFRNKVEARTKQLIADEVNLRELRQALDCTQSKVAKALGISQDNVSRLEQRSDLLLSTITRIRRGDGRTVELDCRASS